MKLNQNIFWRNFTNSLTIVSFRMVIIWKTRNIRSLFHLKDQNDCKSCVIYKENCSCGSHYTGEAKRNAEVKWNEHNNSTKRSDISKATLTTVLHGLSFQMLQNC